MQKTASRKEPLQGADRIKVEPWFSLNSPSATNAESTIMKRSKKHQHQQLLQSWFRRVLQIFEEHHVLRTHTYPKPLFAAESEFSAAGTEEVTSGALFRTKAGRLATLVQVYVLEELSFDAGIKARIAALMAPVTAICTKVNTPEEPTADFDAAARDIPPIQRTVTLICSKMMDLLLEIVASLRSNWSAA